MAYSYPKRTVEDGSIIYTSELADLKTPLGANLSLTQVGSTNTYTQTISNFDNGSNRSEIFYIDFNGPSGRLYRRVQ